MLFTVLFEEIHTPFKPGLDLRMVCPQVTSQCKIEITLERVCLVDLSEVVISARPVAGQCNLLICSNLKLNAVSGIDRQAERAADHFKLQYPFAIQVKAQG